jgi:GntR family transcriptional regulator/MocR family aminotransferase
MPELKRAIAEHLRDHRGVECEAQQIIITSGAQQAFTLIALALLKTGNTVWFEDPGHIAARDSMRMLGADVRSVPIDEEGFNLHLARAKYPTSALIFVTPSHQHPLGVTMSLNRRLELLDYAQQNNTWVVEDDYDSEFRYTGRALPALRALDHTGNVLYVGSFSKSLFPALRLGYLISPASMVDALIAGQTLLSQNVSPLQQQVTARFILDGSFNSHIRKMRSVYQQRRDLLVESLTEQAGELFELETCEAGMHLIAWLRNRSVNDNQAARAIWDGGVDCLPVSLYCDQQKLRPGIMFGFACAAEIEIAPKTVQVARALESCGIR